MSPEKTVLVFDPVSAPQRASAPGEMLSGVRLPLESIRANLEAVLQDWSTILGGASNTLGSYTMEYVDLSLGLAVDGSVGIFGSKAGAEAKGGITVRLVPRTKTGNP